MKKLIIMLWVLTITSGLSAQEATWKKRLEGGDAGRLSEMTLEVIGVGTNLIVKGHDGTEIIVETRDYEGIPEKAKGLKPLSATGEDNTDVGLNFAQRGNKYVLTGASRLSDNADYVLTVPNRLNLKVESMRWTGGDIKIEGMTGEVEARSNVGDIALVNVTGPLVIWTLSSDITIQYDQLSQQGPHAISSTSGEIDITMPPGSKGTFDLKSISGEIYSDLGIELPQKNDMNLVAGSIKAKGTLNGGGVDFSVNSISGDVYLRRVK